MTMNRIGVIVIAFKVILVLCHQSVSKVSSIKSESTENKELSGIRIKRDASGTQENAITNHENDSHFPKLERHSLVVGSDNKQYLIRTERQSPNESEASAVEKAHERDKSLSSKAITHGNDRRATSSKDYDGSINGRANSSTGYSTESRSSEDNKEATSFKEPDPSTIVRVNFGDYVRKSKKANHTDDKKKKAESSESSQESGEICSDGTPMGSTCIDIYKICHKYGDNSVCVQKRCGDPGTHQMMGICPNRGRCIAGPFGQARCMRRIWPWSAWGPCKTISIPDSHCEQTRTRRCFGCRRVEKRPCDTKKFELGPWGKCEEGCIKTREQTFHCRKDRFKLPTDCVEGVDYKYTEWSWWGKCDCKEQQKIRTREVDPYFCNHNLTETKPCCV